MSDETFKAAVSLEDGPTRVAALAAWLQSLAAAAEESPVLVGLAAWQFWRSDVDAVNALRLLQGSVADVAAARLREIAEARGVSDALRALERFVERLGDREPSTEELEEWTRQAWSGTL